MGTKCLENRPQMQTRAAFCGNKVVESPEQCDCGTEEVSIITSKANNVILNFNCDECYISQK